MLFRRKKKKTPSLISLSEIYDTFQQALNIFKEQAEILCNFYKQQFISQRDSKCGSEIILFSVKYEYAYWEEKLNLEVYVAEDCGVNYKRIGYRKAYCSNEVKKNIDLFGDKSVQNAYEILEQLLFLAGRIKMFYKEYDSAIKFKITSPVKNYTKIFSYPTYDEKVMVQKDYLNPVDFKLYDTANFFSLLQKEEIPKVSVNHEDCYEKLVLFVEKYNKKDFGLFDQNNHLLEKYKYKKIENHDFSEIDFDGKNISGLSINKNPGIHIHFDKIEKDVSSCDFNGYDLTHTTLRNFDLTDTDLRNTSATIDLASCVISEESKMQTGTLFDEKNTFLFHSKIVSLEQVQNLGIKIYRK